MNGEKFESFHKPKSIRNELLGLCAKLFLVAPRPLIIIAGASCCTVLSQLRLLRLGSQGRITNVKAPSYKNSVTLFPDFIVSSTEVRPSAVRGLPSRRGETDRDRLQQQTDWTQQCPIQL
jgi:hypothetical protein